MKQLVNGITPKMPDHVIHAANSLRYRDFLTVVLILKDRNAFDDNWIYIHDPSVKVGRVQNFKSWSPEMVPDPSMTCYGLEYFCFEEDGLWNSPDADLIEQAKRELANRAGQAGRHRRRDGGAPAEGVPGLRRRLCQARQHDPHGTGEELSEPAPGRP